MRPQYTSRSRRVPQRIDNQLRRYRLRAAVTQRLLAKRLKVRVSTYSSWERGLTCPSTRLLLRLAKYLGTLAEGLYPELYFRLREDEGDKPKTL